MVIATMNHLQGEMWLGSSQERAMDIAVCSAIASVGVPLSLGAAAMIRVVDNMDPLFSQIRTGQGEEPFRMYKLRTMPPSVDDSTTTNRGYMDERATDLGKLLRKVRLDEIPQLWNIYRGEMSVVGPRPLIYSEYRKIMARLDESTQKAWRHARAVARPGLIDTFGCELYKSGYELDPIGRVEADIAYAENASFSVDTKLIIDCLGLLPGLFGDGEDKAQPRKPHKAVMAVAAQTVSDRFSRLLHAYDL